MLVRLGFTWLCRFKFELSWFIIVVMSSPVKRLAILGSTGSIGRQTLEVVRAFPERFRVVALAAGNRVDVLAGQIEEFQPEFVYFSSLMHDKRKLPDILAQGDREFRSMEDMATHPRVDTVVVATSGKAGLEPVLAAVSAGKTVALANKESLVMAGGIIMSEARRSGAQVLPVDSEHSAIWQCLNGESQGVKSLILTASGGSFRDFSPEQLQEVTVEQALKHPSWRMGKKVTIDSATLMNKGLEIIEAHWLFDVPFDRIEVLVHRQSIIHSMVEFVDGSIKAQLSYPDMRLPIQYALSYPDRLANAGLPRLDWDNIKRLELAPPDLAKYPCLRLAIEAGRAGGTYPAVLCGADEVAVELFLAQRVGFVDIARLVEQVLERHQAVASPGIEEIMAADSWARETVMELVKGVC